MRSETRPVVITDKNGRITTVHRKDSAQASSAKLMVLPVLTTPFLSKRDGLLAQLERLGSDSRLPQSLYAEIKSYASDMDEVDLTNLVGLLEQDKILHEAATSEIHNRLKTSGPLRSRWLRRMNDNYIRLWKEYCGEAKRVQQEAYVEPSRFNVALKSIALVDGLEHYADFALELTADQENDLLTLTSQLYFESIFRPEMFTLLASEDLSGGEDEVRIDSLALINHAIESPEKFAAIMDHVRNPAVTRPAELLHLLGDDGSSSLASGVL